MALASHLRSSGKLLSARRKQATLHVGLPRYRVPAIDIPTRRLAQSRALSAELAEVLSSPSVKETTQFLLEHPIATLVSAVAALYIVPRLVEAFIRYLALPVAIAVLSFYCLEYPEEAAMTVYGVLDAINSNPEVTSVVLIGLALLGLVPALLTAAGATALVYLLLSVAFGPANVPEVKQMQGKFGETLTRVTVLGKAAAAKFGSLSSPLLK